MSAISYSWPSSAATRTFPDFDISAGSRQSPDMPAGHVDRGSLGKQSERNPAADTAACASYQCNDIFHAVAQSTTQPCHCEDGRPAVALTGGSEGGDTWGGGVVRSRWSACVASISVSSPSTSLLHELFLKDVAGGP